MSRRGEPAGNSSGDDRGVADLFGASSRPFWREQDLGPIYRHQMAVAVQVELAGMDPAAAARLPGLCQAHGLLLRSFGDLFAHPSPPLELLEMTKRFAKALRRHPDSPLPPDVASVLYYASIAAALARCGRRISALPDPELRRGLAWALARTWIDPTTAALLREATALLGEPKGESP